MACNSLVCYACTVSGGGRLLSTEDREIVAWAFKARANAHLQFGRVDEALSDLNDAVAADPTDASGLLSRCRVRAAARRELDLALADCNAVLGADPTLPVALDSRGLVFLQQGDYAAAIADYDTAIAAAADLTSSIYGRGLAKARLGQADAAQADFATALAQDATIAEQFASYGLTP